MPNPEYAWRSAYISTHVLHFQDVNGQQWTERLVLLDRRAVNYDYNAPRETHRTQSWWTPGDADRHLALVASNTSSLTAFSDTWPELIAIAELDARTCERPSRPGNAMDVGARGFSCVEGTLVEAEVNTP
jgi:hypothetical protein